MRLCFSNSTRLAPGWALIRINFDPIQEIGGWALYREWALFARSRVSHMQCMVIKINSLLPDWVSVSLLHMPVYMYVSRPLFITIHYITSTIPYCYFNEGRSPCKVAKHTGNMLRWLRTVRKNLSSLPSSNFQAAGYCLRRVWLERSANDRKAETSVVRRNGQKERRLASEKHRIGTKMVSEAIS